MCALTASEEQDLAAMDWPFLEFPVRRHLSAKVGLEHKRVLRGVTSSLLHLGPSSHCPEIVIKSGRVACSETFTVLVLVLVLVPVPFMFVLVIVASCVAGHSRRHTTCHNNSNRASSRHS